MNQNPYYLSRLFADVDDVDNGYAISGEDGLAESTPEQDYLLEQEHLAEQDPEIDPETLVHSDFYGYGYQPVTYFYADDEDAEETEDEEDEPTDEEIEEATVAQAAIQAYREEKMRYFNANAVAQAMEDLGIDTRSYAEYEEPETYFYADTQYQDPAETVLQSVYWNEMNRLYSENEVADDEEIIHVDEDGNEVAPEVVAQALLDDMIYSRYFAGGEEELETEELADDVQDLHEGEELDGVDAPQTAEEELKEEATKKQASIYELEERVTALL